MSVEKLMVKLEEEYKSTQYLCQEKLPKEVAARKKSCNNLQVRLLHLLLLLRLILSSVDLGITFQ